MGWPKTHFEESVFVKIIISFRVDLDHRVVGKTTTLSLFLEVDLSGSIRSECDMSYFIIFTEIYFYLQSLSLYS